MLKRKQQIQSQGDVLIKQEEIWPSLSNTIKNNSNNQIYSDQIIKQEQTYLNHSPKMCVSPQFKISSLNSINRANREKMLENLSQLTLVKQLKSSSKKIRKSRCSRDINLLNSSFEYLEYEQSGLTLQTDQNYDGSDPTSDKDQEIFKEASDKLVNNQKRHLQKFFAKKQAKNNNKMKKVLNSFTSGEELIHLDEQNQDQEYWMKFLTGVEQELKIIQTRKFLEIIDIFRKETQNQIVNQTLIARYSFLNKV